MHSKPYNLAMDCLDKHAASLENKHKKALIVAKQDPKTEKIHYQSYTYSQLTGLSNRLADSLAKLNFKKGSRVLLRLPNGVEFCLSFIALIKAGLIPVPTSTELTFAELSYLLKDSQAQALICDLKGLPEKLHFAESLYELPHLKKLILLSESQQKLPNKSLRWQDLLKEGQTNYSPKPSAAQDPAYWLYTSGTSGEPKAVIHAHRSIPAHDERAKHWQGVKLGDVIFNTSSLNWSYALTAGLLDMWRHGLTSVIYCGKPQAKALVEIINRVSVTTFMSVPGLYARLVVYLKENPTPFKSLRIALSAGEKLSQKTLKQFKELSNIKIHQGLGMTEHSVYLVQPPGEDLPSFEALKALESTKIAILNSDLSIVKAGESGILASHRSCPGLMLGYHGQSAEETFKEGWFLSGDLAYQDPEGYYHFLGRRDDVITAGGYRISPLEVEKVLQEHPAIEECAVLAKNKEEKTWILAQVLLCQDLEDQEKLKEDILTWAKNYLAHYKVPREIIFVKELPKTRTGKLLRKIDQPSE